MPQPFVPFTNGLEVVLNFTQQDGSPALNTFMVERTAPWTASLITTMLGAFITWYKTGDGTNKYQGFQNNNITLVSAAGRDLTTQSGLTVIDSGGLPASGLQTDGAAALGLSFVLTSRSGLAGRSFRGRTYLVGLDVGSWSSMTDNLINSTTAAHLVLAFNALITAVPAADSDCTLVIPSRRHNGGFRDAGVMTPVLSFGFHNLNTDFQRRRAPSHNIHR